MTLVHLYFTALFMFQISQFVSTNKGKCKLKSFQAQKLGLTYWLKLGKWPVIEQDRGNWAIFTSYKSYLFKQQEYICPNLFCSNGENIFVQIIFVQMARIYLCQIILDLAISGQWLNKKGELSYFSPGQKTCWHPRVSTHSDHRKHPKLSKPNFSPFFKLNFYQWKSVG